MTKPSSWARPYTADRSGPLSDLVAASAAAKSLNCPERSLALRLNHCVANRVRSCQLDMLRDRKAILSLHLVQLGRRDFTGRLSTRLSMSVQPTFLLSPANSDGTFWDFSAEWTTNKPHNWKSSCRDIRVPVTIRRRFVLASHIATLEEQVEGITYSVLRSPASTVSVPCRRDPTVTQN